MTSNHHAPYDLGHTRATMDGTEGSEGASRSGPQKPVPSSELQSATRLHEAGIAKNCGSECRGE